jgi:hypothetical protein
MRQNCVRRIGRSERAKDTKGCDNEEEENEGE